MTTLSLFPHPNSTDTATTSSACFDSLEALGAAVAQCTACPLAPTRTNVVISDGNPTATIMVIGEGPGQQEDETGTPFVGRAGQLLTTMLASVSLNRAQDVYICNMVKCRPPQNRKPTKDELAACRPFLESQIALVQPKIIVLAGATALQGLLGCDTPISKIRGQWLETPYNGARSMAIFHPSYLLRNHSRDPGSPRWLAWQDLQAIKAAAEALPTVQAP